MAFCPCFPELRPCIAQVLVEKHMHAHNNTPSHTETGLGLSDINIAACLGLCNQEWDPSDVSITTVHWQSCRILSHFCLLVRVTDLGRSWLPFFRKWVETSSSTYPDCTVACHSFLLLSSLNILMLLVDLLVLTSLFRGPYLWAIWMISISDLTVCIIEAFVVFSAVWFSPSDEVLKFLPRVCEKCRTSGEMLWIWGPPEELRYSRYVFLWLTHCCVSDLNLMQFFFSLAYDSDSA